MESSMKVFIAFTISISVLNNVAYSVMYNITSGKSICINADAQCQQEFPNSIRASIHNSQQMALAIAAVSNVPGEYYTWIGLQNDGQQWQWVDNSAFDYGTDITGGVYPWNYNAWYSQPDDCVGNLVQCCTVIDTPGGDWHDIQQTTSLSLKSLCDTTNIPTSPTQSPTFPTQSPTFLTQSPTNSLTPYPTIDPTETLTKTPTNPPSSEQPTMSQTYMDTTEKLMESLAPTMSPTKSPAKSTTSKPTKSPVNILTTVEDMEDMEDMDGMLSKDKKKVTETWVWVILTVGLCCCIVVLIVIRNSNENDHITTLVVRKIHKLKRSKDKQKIKGKKQKDNKDIEMNTIKQIAINDATEGNVEWMFMTHSNN